jgi:hypothetical protein
MTSGGAAMDVMNTLTILFASPSVENLWTLRSDLLEAGHANKSTLLTVLSDFRRFLAQLDSRATSKGYSDLASKLDIGALSSIVGEEVLTNAQSPELAEKLLAGVLTEGLAVLATRQHVKAWDNELKTVCDEATWIVHDWLWRFTTKHKPDLEAATRRSLLDQLIAPLRENTTTVELKIALLTRLFQILLADAVVEAVRSED